MASRRIPNNLNGRKSNSGRQRSGFMRELNGYKTLPQETPPVFISQPWNNMTLILRKVAQPAELKIVVEDIRVALRAQGGFNNVVDNVEKSAVHFDFRIKNYSVWAIDGSSMSLFPMDIIHPQSELTRIDSNAQKNMYARAGYALPLAQSSVTISTANDRSKVLVILMGGSKYEIHIHVLWKGADTALPRLGFAYPLSTFKLKRKLLEDELAALDIAEKFEIESCSSSPVVINYD